jgi:hypothetical protein
MPLLYSYSTQNYLLKSILLKNKSLFCEFRTQIYKGEKRVRSLSPCD